jgi:hypothetical protein
VLQKITDIYSRTKIRIRKKSVMFSLNFPGPRRSRRTGDGIEKVSGFPQGLNNGGLSRAGWSGNDEEDSVTFEFQ